MQKKLITNFDLLKVTWRTLCFQAVWNFERMLNIGFAYAIFPIAKKLYPNLEEQKKFIIRHLDFFNTHPYLASISLGIVISEEEKALKENKEEINNITDMKMKLMGPFGALGDNLFWATFRPLFALIGVMLIFWDFKWGVFVFLIAYNLVHLPVRYLGIKKGYQWDEEIIGSICNFPIQKIISLVQKIAMFLIGFGVVSLVDTQIIPKDMNFTSKWIFLVFSISMAISIKYLKGNSLLFFLFIAFSIIISYII
ncbi:MAG: PTS system mannose/fructose/sorbose family transporter subunit IID [bacterium]|nr:PTS system mannose/fructose/sorbose family transporter subunit IID [bacterium]